MSADVQGSGTAAAESWVRREPEVMETAGAGAMALLAGLAVGASVFYLARTFLARDPVRLTPPDGKGEGSGG